MGKKRTEAEVGDNPPPNAFTYEQQQLLLGRSGGCRRCARIARRRSCGCGCSIRLLRCLLVMVLGFGRRLRGLRRFRLRLSRSVRRSGGGALGRSGRRILRGGGALGGLRLRHGRHGQRRSQNGSRKDCAKLLGQHRFSSP